MSAPPSPGPAAARVPARRDGTVGTGGAGRVARRYQREPDSTRHQVDQAIAVAGRYNRQPLFLFVNVSATHVPHGHCIGDSTDSARSQQAALAYADPHLGRLISTLTSEEPWLIIMCADHGDAFGEDGYRGRGIAHPMVLNVPYAAWHAQSVTLSPHGRTQQQPGH
ncbi:sulfatase-like hydrolase/transferase [Streptomyces sp. NBC_01136]|uniref:sulfatase-like hydrolase/transferase n=1 Tax=Streptomyces sp. NBC_01384 TaxID=2903847 RepID=UPI003250E637|nr:sulfatase-like hydrolase/transferase [Streptomyces sp. NBC_01136]